MRQRLFAAVYDRLSARTERELAPLRQRSVGQAHGDVLELGGGTGANLPYFAADVRLTVFEPNPWMAARLRRKAARSARPVQVDVEQTRALPYATRRFDAVVATLVLCSVDDQAAVLAEIRRVLRDAGQFVFLEHVAAPSPDLRRWQRRLTPIQRFLADGCELDRDTAARIRAAGFASVRLHELEVRGLPALARHMISGVAIA